MINHIVMWKLAPTDSLADKQTAANSIKEKLESLRGKVPQLIDLHVGINIDNPHANFDVVLYSQFNNMDELAAYQVHPEHQAVGQYIKSLVVERACVDYSI